MGKIQYIEKNFSNERLAIIMQANQIVEKYQAEGLDLTLRQLYYQFVSRDLIPNKQKEYTRLSTIISDARLAGLIDWGAIVDRSRYIRGNTHWRDPGHIIHAAATSFQLNHWEGQEYRVEVWVEKEALIGVIAGICEQLDAPYFACKGYVSQSEMWNAAQRLIGYQEEGAQPVIIHLGDHDPSGIDMSRDIFDRCDLFMENAGPIVKRIALNMNQVEQYGPPPNPAKLTDTRCHSYIKKYGTSSWELDALEPSILSELIGNTIAKYRDVDIYAKVLDEETKYKKLLNRVERNWKNL